MSDFNFLKDLEVTADMTQEFTLHQISVGGKTPTLIVSPATEANKPYFNALLKRVGKSARQIRAGAMSASMIEENRDEDKELYPKFVIKGWRDMADTNGDVEFTPENCADFIKAVPDWLFDDIRNFCGNPASFTEVLNVQVTAKNSKSGSSSS